MPASDSDQCELIDRLAEEFAARYRRGERPALKEYVEKYPDLAEDIRVLFPALVEMEQVKEDGREAAPPAAFERPPLQQVGDYRILREVGHGGMGVVYEAEQVSLGRRVALKLLPPHVSTDPHVLERFRREARSAAKLHHTNIVPVFEVGRDGEACFYAMQFIQGQSLDQIIGELRHLMTSPPPESATTKEADAPRSAVDQLAHSLLTGHFTMDRAPITPAPESADAANPSTAAVTSSAVLPGQTDLSSVRTDHPHYFQSVARIGCQTANALAYAHARGIIHRDIKPSNLLLDTTGVVWITDFGLAKTQDVALTTTGDIVGTFRYMAPERFQGEGDERADVYALGLTLYELLVLRPAFQERDRLRLIDEIKHQEPIRPRALDRRIPRDLETIVLKAIHKEAKRRYQSADAMAEDLRRFLANEPIRARRAGRLERLRLWSRRNPSLAVLLLLLLLVAGGSTATAFYLRATLNESEGNRRRAETAELEGKHKLWLSYLSEAQARRMSRQPGQRFGSLRALREALALPAPPGHSRDELRTEAIAALCLADLELVREGGREVVGATGFAIDGAFLRYAVADKDGNVSVRRLSDDDELLHLPGGGRVDQYTGLQFSPDGRFLHHICNTPRGIRSRLWDLAAPQPQAVLDDDHGRLAFRPDSRQFAATYPDRTLRLFEAASGRELRRFSAGAQPIVYLHWNPRFPQVLLHTQASLRLLNVDTGEVSEVGPKLPSRVSCAAWHPEGRLLALSDSSRKIHLWDVPSNRLLLPPLEGHNNDGVVMRFNHAGDRLLSNDWSGNWHLWDTRSGRPLLTMPVPWGTAAYFRADDDLVATGGEGKVQLFRFRRGEELRTVVHPLTTSQRGYDFAHGPPALDREGRFCAINLFNDSVALVDVTRAEETVRLPLRREAPLCFDLQGALWTHGDHGLLRWPASDDPQKGQRRYGPPQRFLSKIGLDLHGSSSDAGVVAIPNFSTGSFVLHRDTKRLLRLAPQDDVRSCAVSPDGRWVAAGSHNVRAGGGAKVWDAKTGRHVTDLPVAGICRVRFSPDGKWLLTSGGGARLWAVGSWTEGPKLGGTPLNPLGAFSHDGNLLALGDVPGMIRLVVTDSGAELARLTAPERSRLFPCCFTPDGTQLIAVGDDTRDMHIFDLRRIRAGLAELDLDWDAPPLSAGSTPPPPPLKIDFDPGKFR
ncbi:MAG TPA: WD40 repeat domain-containing serine/threonine protein kinase [Gemmataceae bacterium]|jgi:serine/threonine protein kinase/WD40 repeat protein